MRRHPPTVQLNIRTDPDTNGALDAMVQATGTPKNQIVNQALLEFFQARNKPPSDDLKKLARVA